MDPFLLRSSMNEIDFNRPPSSLSIYGDPEHIDPKRAYSLGSALVDNEDSDDEHDQPDLTITADAMDVDAPSSTGMKPPRMRKRSPWLSDSLISPPVSQEWNHPPQERAYTQSPPHDVDMYDGFSLGLGPGLAAFVPGGEQVEDPVLRRSQNATDGDHLKHMFDGLDLAPKSRFLNTRTRSLDSPSRRALYARSDLFLNYWPAYELQWRRGVEALSRGAGRRRVAIDGLGGVFRSGE
ncbi:hypothetical protein C8J57DRAFT_1668954 [Mycena rebaudengoi]|nr:hypothetical protein C8J57DRAFT_1668954 [Mycena rebaudengoi]